MVSLARCYEAGRGIMQDLTKAVDLYAEASARGDSVATNNLGVMYENGQGCEQSYERAAQLYQKAADNGNVDALVNLAWCYERGHGVPESKDKAIELFQLAKSKRPDASTSAAGRAAGAKPITTSMSMAKLSLK